MRLHHSGFVRGLGRWLADFSVALALFWFAVFSFGGSQNHAHAIPLPTRASATAGVERPAALNVHSWGRSAQFELRVLRDSREDYTRSLTLLSAAFAGLVASNLAFLRHLRRVYASPRRGVWRRG
jgi:hypothetical protein